MSELVIRLSWLSGQVTILSLAAASLSVLAARRHPGAGAAVASLGLAGLVALTVLATLPMPTWWSWTGLLAEAAAIQSPSTRPGIDCSPLKTALDADAASGLAGPAGAWANEPEHAGPRWSLADLHRLWTRLIPGAGAAARRPSAWGGLLAITLLAGMGLGSSRLLLGLYAVFRWHRNSRPLDDPALLALLAHLLCGMGCRRRVAVREASDVGGPVTVGWRRPVILLPPSWRTWGKGELRAVLAHEAAHVRRQDYAAWLLARLGVALHFYHPLAHWLAAQLHLQQELAADALGAAHAGGRRAYLQALARLALRQQNVACDGPARAFLPARGTLVRRIAMLRTEERGARGACPWPLAVMLLGLVGVAVSALRGPARAGDEPRPADPQAAEGQAPKTPMKESPAAAQRPPFAYCLCSPDAAGFFAFRPSVLFSDPRIKEAAEKEMAGLLEMIGVPSSFPKLEEIEQVTGCIFLKFNEKAPKGQRGMLLGSLLTLRTTAEYDWKKIVESVARKVAEVPLEGRTYYRVALRDFKSPLLLGMLADPAWRRDGSVCFFQPDPRTLAMGSEQQFKEMIRNGPAVKPAWAVAGGWERVERGVLAVAISNQQQRFSKSWLASPPEEVPPAVNAAVAKTTTLVFGVDYDGELRADLFAACANEQDAVTVANALLNWVAQGQTALHESLAKPEQRAEARLRWGKKFLDQTSVGLEGAAPEAEATLAHASGHAKAGLAEVFDFLSGAKVEAVRVPDEKK